jgi:hypothetical protein
MLKYYLLIAKLQKEDPMVNNMTLVPFDTFGETLKILER